MLTYTVNVHDATQTKFMTPNTNRESSGTFVVTTSEGTRFYAFFRCCESNVFVAVSSLPTMQFSRNVLDLLTFEESSDIPTLLEILCEIPIVPMGNLRYEFQMSKGSACVDFSCIDQVEDSDIDSVAMQLMTPSMLVRSCCYTLYTHYTLNTHYTHYTLYTLYTLYTGEGLGSDHP